MEARLAIERKEHGIVLTIQFHQILTLALVRGHQHGTHGQLVGVGEEGGLDGAV